MAASDFGVESSATPLARPNNAFSQKIAGIMSTSYTDASIRMALLSLDKKIDKNTGEVRRHLRSNTEADVIKANGAALKEFSQFINRLEGLGQTIETLNKRFEGMENLVNKADNDTKSAVQETKGLIEHQNNIKIKQAILAAFKAKFVISESEAEILVSSSHPIDKQFFDVLNKVKKIHADCDALLATDNQELGLEIMSKMSTYMDQAYDRLFFVIQKDLKTVKNDDQTSKKQLSQALKVLSERPAQFEVALKTLSESRQRSLTTLFVNALTTDTAHEKAIDFYAFDPLRYVGDILAWIHSEIVNERETVSSLFGSEMKSATGELLWTLDPTETIDSLVDTITSGVVKPFKLRIEQVVSAETRIGVIYQLSDKLNFYSSMFSKFLKPESALITTLGQMQKFCMRQFDKCLHEKIVDIKEHFLVAPNSDLQPPDFMTDVLGDLKGVLQSYESSVRYSPEGDAETKQIVQDLTEPYLECCNRIASDLPDTESEIFTINCLDAVKLSLQLFMFTQYKIDQLDSRIDEIAEVLVQRLLQQFLTKSGLAPYLKELTGNSTSDDLKTVFTKEALADLSFTLDNFLPSASMDFHSFLFKLASPRLATRIAQDASRLFSVEFSKVERTVLDLYSMEDSRIYFPRTYMDVCVLLGIEDENMSVR